MNYIFKIICLLLLTTATHAELTHNLIGKQLIIGINNYPIHQSWITFIKENHISGVIFISDAYKDANHVKEAITTIKKNINHKMFFCIDQEGGKVNRIKKNMIQLPAANTIAKHYSEKEAFNLYQKQAKELATIGINVNFSPVLDILYDDANTVIGSRSYGNNPKIVFNYAKQAINASLLENILPVIKHFPGHGFTSIDSHTNMPIHKDIFRLIKTDIVPFKKSIRIGAPAIMAAHILYPRIDKQYPASLSEEIITRYLIKDLKFEGIIFSDDISMGAIQKNFKINDAIIKTIEAGIHQTIIITPLENLVKIVKRMDSKIKDNKNLRDKIKQNIQIVEKFK